MPNDIETAAEAALKRLPRAERRRQLLDTALLIVREEGADRLTLGQLAKRARVSKPVAYDHFTTRSGLLIALYRWIDTERVETFREAMARGERSLAETVDRLATAYIACATEIGGEFQAVGAALVGSADKAAVLDDLQENLVQMFVAVLQPHSRLPRAELEQRCVGLVGAGEALAASMRRGRYVAAEATATFAALIRGAIRGA